MRVIAATSMQHYLEAVELQKTRKSTNAEASKS
jgi:hypothetical protein